MKKRVWPCNIIILILCFSAVVQVQSQDRQSSEKQIGQWKDMIRKYPLSKNSKELVSIHSFPKEMQAEEEIYLWRTTGIERDSEGNIFALDVKWKAIFKFDSQGAFIKKAGRPGQGPGEFQNPYAFCTTKSHLIVSDTAKYEISIWDLDLNYLRSFKVFKAYVDIVAGENGSIYGAPLLMNNQMNLIDVMDHEGKLLYSFGKAMYGSEKNWVIPNLVNICINEDNEVFVAYQHFATVCKFGPSGQLSGVIRIDNKIVREREKANIRSIESGDRVFWTVIAGIRAAGPGFAIMHNAPFVQIMEFDAEEQVSDEYWLMRSYDLRANDFILGKGEGKSEITILLTSPENKIEVFRPKSR